MTRLGDRVKGWTSRFLRRGFHKLPGTLQSPTKRQPVDKTNWRACGGCRRPIPRYETWSRLPDGRAQMITMDTFVCPFCSDVHVGVRIDREEIRGQAACHECHATLGDGYQCPKCTFPRGWMRVSCPYCGARQPVYAPHWVVHCDTFTLECVACESRFVSLCIC